MGNARDYSRIRYNSNPYRDREVVAIRGNSLYTVVVGEGYTEWNGNPTSYFNGHITWTDAEARSRLFGGHLASINSEDEDIFVWNAFQSFSWIGYTDFEVEEHWKWSDGSRSTYDNFADRNTPDEDYAAYWDASPGNWHDCFDFGDAIRGGIAEIPLTSSITFSSTPKEGAGIFTTSINLSAGTTSSGNLAEGATVYWKVSGITADDLASGELSGSGTITNGKLDLEHSLKSDSDTGESFEVSVFSDVEMTQQIGSRNAERINELAPKVTIVKAGSTWEYLIPPGDNAAQNWVTNYAPEGWNTSIGGWSKGLAPFGNNLGGRNGDHDFDYNTYWEMDWIKGDPDLLVRRSFDVNLDEVSDLRFFLGVDNLAVIYLNGKEIFRVDEGNQPEEYAKRWEYSGTIKRGDLVNGTNIIAVELQDYGYITAFDMLIEAYLNGQIGSTSPTLQSTTATNNQLILSFSEDIQIAGGGSLNPAYMTVTVDGQTRKITRSQITAPDHPTIHTASQLALTLSGRSLDRASSISISYNPPSNGSNQGFITDLSDNPLAPIASQAVDTYSSSTNISKSGIASAYKNLILTGTTPITGYGNTQNNTITGNDANNILDGLSGSDTMIGGLGNDTYVVDNIGDLITELASAGTDTVQSSIAYTLADDLENLTLLGSAAINGTGNSANNVLTGNTGANVLNGNGGTDTLIGGRGSDTYIVDSTDDSITETGTSSDVDSVQASVSWSLGTNLENLTLTGTSTIDGSGNERNNTISGNDAANILDGGNGGTDRLTGLAGADTFRFSTRPSSFRNTTADQITDFLSAQGDKIQIAKSAFGITASTATLSVVSNTAALNTALSGSAQFIYNTANGELHWNQNGITRGAGSGGVLAILDNRATLSAGDLMLI